MRDFGRRGCGRVGISFNNPPIAICAKSASVTSNPQTTRDKTQSAPFNAGERAHPGKPITGFGPMLPRNNKFPGSTGMPNRCTFPPACETAVGATSAQSDVADPDRIITKSACDDVMAAAMLSASWGTIWTLFNVTPSMSKRAAIASLPLSPAPPSVSEMIRSAERRFGADNRILSRAKSQADQFHLRNTIADDFDRRDQTTSRHLLKFRNRCDRNHWINGICRNQARGVQLHHTRSLGNNIHAPCKWRGER